MKEFWHKTNRIKLNDQQVRRIGSTKGMSEVITTEEAEMVGVVRWIDTDRPVPTVLQRVVTHQPDDITFTQTYSLVDKFQDIEDGPTKAEQEAEYLAGLQAKEDAAALEIENDENIKNDTLITFLKTKSMFEIEEKINQIVVDQASTTDAIARLAKLIAHTLKNRG